MKDAEVLLIPIAFDMHAGTQAGMARSIIERIRKGDVKGAQNATRDYLEKKAILDAADVDLGGDEDEGQGNALYYAHCDRMSDARKDE